MGSKPTKVSGASCAIFDWVRLFFLLLYTIRNYTDYVYVYRNLIMIS